MQFCKTIVTEQDSTMCECFEFGTFSLLAEMTDKPFMKESKPWLEVMRMIGNVTSVLATLVLLFVVAR